MKKSYIIGGCIAAAIAASPAVGGVADDNARDSAGFHAHSNMVDPLVNAGLDDAAYIAIHAPCPRQDDVHWCDGWVGYASMFDLVLSEQVKDAKQATDERAAAAR
jgi:hypothetical protein